MRKEVAALSAQPSAGGGAGGDQVGAAAPSQASHQHCMHVLWQGARPCAKEESAIECPAQHEAGFKPARDLVSACLSILPHYSIIVGCREACWPRLRLPRLSECKMLTCMQVVLRHVALAAADPLRAVALPSVAVAAARAAAARSSEAALLQARAALPCAVRWQLCRIQALS